MRGWGGRYGRHHADRLRLIAAEFTEARQTSHSDNPPTHPQMMAKGVSELRRELDQQVGVGTQ